MTDYTSTLINIIIVAALIIGDIVSGLLAAIATKSIASTKMRNGLWHKSAYILVIALAGLIEWGASKGVFFGIDVPVLAATCVYIGLTEITSIIENIAIINPELKDTPLLSLFKRSNNTKGDAK